MIILEGPDNTGKTTLARQLRDEHGYSLFKQDQHSTYEETIDVLAGDPALALSKVVFDRMTCFSEQVYAPVVRTDNGRFDRKQMHNMLLQLMSLRPILVHCYNVANDFDSRPQYPSSVQNGRIAMAYEQLVENTWMRLFPTLQYNWETPFNVSSLVQRDSGPPEWWAQMFRQRVAGVGFLSSPKYLILAESIGPRNTHQIPFEAGPSGVFMSELLHESGTNIADVFLTNYVKGTNSERENQLALRTELEQIKPNGVIILGSIAKRAIPIINATKLPWTHIVHPSYWLRSGKPKAEYVQLFKQAKATFDVFA